MSRGSSPSIGQRATPPWLTSAGPRVKEWRSSTSPLVVEWYPFALFELGVPLITVLYTKQGTLVVIWLLNPKP